MTELRQNLITRDWVIIATERAKRPDDFIKPEKSQIVIPSYQPNCPFCLGNEHLTGPESFRLKDNNGWRVRAVPNKYPALTPTGEKVRNIDKTFRSLTGVGFHEVIIEHPRHDVIIPFLELKDIVNILRVYRLRYAEIKKDKRIQTILIFKNHGKGAGTSLEHPHSQLAATPIVPYQLRIRINEAMRYFDDTGECLFCRTLADELAAEERIIYASKHFVAFIPYAALSPFHTWIFPRHHTSSFDEITESEMLDLADNLKTVLGKLYYGLNNPDYNYIIRSIPTDEQRTDYFHWYLAIVPRVSLTAGFEMGSGMFINTAVPEENAAFLRSVEIPD
ncbi:galactose-1-phosphate uridylyltransferase [Dapis sp. BLCC M126]|uniref:galactose-1-phosphate uridylyltransferase n=1 Tax=Dapis sp. BLCC M126 TaxID=3400189 RepID=UPI003CF3E2DF